MSEMKHTLEIQPDPHGTRTETRYASGFPLPPLQRARRFPGRHRPQPAHLHPLQPLRWHRQSEGDGHGGMGSGL